MGMSRDEIIKKENEIAAEFQKVVDTHIVNDNGDTIDEMYCDDTEVIEEHLQRCKFFADYHNQIADTMRKYQKIERIIEVWHQDIYAKDFECIAEIADVVEEGNDDFVKEHKHE